MPKAKNTSHINWSEYFQYDDSSPSHLRHLLSKGGIKSGSVAGYIHHTGYYIVKLNSFQYRVHRIIWEMHNPPLSENEKVDHIDGNKLNNKISNLRAVSETLNIRNGRMRNTNTTGVTGVSVNMFKEYKYYMAHSVNLNGKQKSVYFSVSKLGEEKAFEMACNKRKEMIDALNLQGAGYTERHGVAA